MRELSSCALHIDGKGLESHAWHGTTDFPLGCYRDDLRVSRLPPHWHDHLELLLVVEGSATFSAGVRRFTVDAGDGVFVNSGVVHGAQSACEGPTVLNTIVFHPRFVAGGTESVFWQNYIGRMARDPSLQAVPLRREESWGIRCIEAVCAVLEAYRREEFGYEFAVRAELSNIVCELCRRLPAEVRPASLRVNLGERRIKTMLQFVHDHFSEDLTAEDIAGSACISASECLRCFHAVVGSTPIQYLKEYRVDQAARLLASTDRKVSDIALACGFRDMSYFAKTFRCLQGCTPTAYRKRVGNLE